ncbi:uncharacterized protein [Magallana gigas]|uniref:uncharacterized protein isoform X2 n=1 Tax=Magallana gigas TaxID=29159 RepID=UPI0033409236
MTRMSFHQNLLYLCYISVLTIGLASAKLKRGYYPNLIDFCANDEVYVGIPWNCHGYLHCQNANGLKMPFWIDCPASLYYNYGSKTCTWPQNVSKPCPSTGDVVMSFCPDYPAVQVLHPTQCAQFYDCSNMNSLPNQPAYLNECPYPKLFNDQTLRCEDYASVDCGDRAEPLSPCDYVRHQCSGPGCTPCTDLIPGCEGVPNGPTSYQGRLLTKFYLMCKNNKTESIEICRDGVFDPVLGRCTREVDPRAVDILCTTNPFARMEHPGDCTKYFDCRDKNQMIKECTYPKLYSPTQQACLDFQDVQCNGRREYKAPCDYKAYQCTGTNCPVCELEHPSCEGLPDGKNAFLGREQTPWYIECLGERTINTLTCPGQNIFDPVERRCLGEDIAPTLFPDKAPYDPEEVAMQAIKGIPPMINIDGQRPPPPNMRNPPNPVSPANPMFPTNPRNSRNPVSGQMHPMCVGNEGLLIADPNNCARYFNCSSLAVRYEGFELNQDECPYPQLFSIETGFCEDFPEVNCKGRFVPKAPCQYLNSQRNCNGPMCALPCEERSPSCEGMRDGNNTFIGRELSPFYISCFKERTLSVGICRYGVYDPNLRFCTTELDPYSVDTFCTERPTKIFPHIANCARYYNCSAMMKDPVLGRYLRECPFPQLFNIESLSCVPREAANCRWRYEPKDPSDPVAFCTENPLAIMAHPDNCARYIDCTNRNSRIGQYQHECRYPDLFDSYNNSCKSYREINCGTRPEPKAPCDYKMNLICENPAGSCPPCEAEHPSCIGKRDGPQAVPGRKNFFMECMDERTKRVTECPAVAPNFDPALGSCAMEFDPLNPSPYCKTNPSAVVPHPNNCHQYIDCRQMNTPLGNYLQECPYPLLVSENDTNSGTPCQSFDLVNCGRRLEPKSPCDYEFSHKPCTEIDQRKCVPCSVRLPSCRNLRDGTHPHPTIPNKYLICKMERTLRVMTCLKGVFDEALRQCREVADSSNPVAYCQANPNERLPDSDNCARFYDCSLPNSKYGAYVDECEYPKLYDSELKRCRPFMQVRCGRRRVPIDPCDYIQNELCPVGQTTCKPCRERIPSCNGLPNGNNTYPGQPGGPLYITCFNDRTIFVRTCEAGIYDPIVKSCVSIASEINPANPRAFCDANPGVKVAHPRDCSKYFDCSRPNGDYGQYMFECKYPDLFDQVSRRCEAYSSVSCGSRVIPLNPCDSLQNQCRPGDLACVPCAERLPSCVGRENGNNTFPGRDMSDTFVICWEGRTVSVETCPEGYFDPKQRKCRTEIGAVAIRAYCEAHPGEIKANPVNCAQYFDCGEESIKARTFLRECPYPHVFDDQSSTCVNFTLVDCGKRREYTSPCDYLQNRCPPSNPTCKPCSERHFDCSKLVDGLHPTNSDATRDSYVICFRGRSIATEKCREGVFDPVERRCTRLRSGGALGRVTDTGSQGMLGRVTDTGSQGMLGRVTDNTQTRPREGSQGMLGRVTDNTQTRPREGSQGMLGRVTDNTQTRSREGTQGMLGRVREATQLTEDMVKKHCTEKPKDILPHPLQCAQYYDCRQAIGDSHLRECRYPQLFDITTMTCKNFSDVTCGDRLEPQAPCDYLQNHCEQNSANCVPCEDRLPSCINLPDNNNPYPGKLDSEYYIKCYRNRTVSVEACQVSKYNPATRQCSENVSPVVLGKFCRDNPTSIIPDPENCGRYYNCSDPSTVQGLNKPYLRECTYPKLFASPAVGCQLFMMVDCAKRKKIPMSPCEYVENQCFGTNCEPCESKFPSCIGKPDGSNVFPAKENTGYYIVCYRQRTVAIVSCNQGVYSHSERACVSDPKPAIA